MGASCDRSRTSEPGASAANEPTQAKTGERIEQLPGIDTSQLTDHELTTWTDLVNEQLSPCGEPMSIARCVAQKHGCRACVPGARYLTRLVLEGYDKASIEQQFKGRFGADGKREFSIDASKVRGSPMAPVTLVEFSDFQCPYCAAAHPELERVLREHEGRVKLVFKHYPLPSHTRAPYAARAAEAAARQGKFWEMADQLFANQRALEDTDLMGYAQKIGLDMERFQADYASEAVAAAVAADRAEGEKVKVEGTPTLYVNGRKLDEPFKTLPAYLAEELQL
jgi:protein-disulfide isomerase